MVLAPGIAPEAEGREQTAKYSSKVVEFEITWPVPEFAELQTDPPIVEQAFQS